MIFTCNTSTLNKAIQTAVQQRGCCQNDPIRRRGRGTDCRNP